MRFIGAFQSLIGRLKTGEYAVVDAQMLHMFQSLIGRLKTRVEEVVMEVFHGFQSLIGRLKTPTLSPIADPGLVSIPHR